MSLGYDTFDAKRNFEKEGITGQVQRYSKEGMNYPCYILRSEKDNPIGMHQIKVLKYMFDVIVSYSKDLEDNPIYIYFCKDNKVARLGKIRPHQVKAFLRLFDGNYIDCYMDKETELKGDYLFVLAD